MHIRISHLKKVIDEICKDNQRFELKESFDPKQYEDLKNLQNPVKVLEFTFRHLLDCDPQYSFKLIKVPNANFGRCSLRRIKNLKF